MRCSSSSSSRRRRQRQRQQQQQNSNIIVSFVLFLLLYTNFNTVVVLSFGIATTTTTTTTIQRIIQKQQRYNYHHHHQQQQQQQYFLSSSTTSLQVGRTTTSVSDILDRNLSSEEKDVVNVVRATGPSVAFVTSIWPASPFAIQQQQRQRTQQQQQRGQGGSRSSKSPKNTSPPNNNNNTKTDTADSSILPKGGVSLGSGSGFVVDNTGYIVTNYHVIEPTYQLQQMITQMENGINSIESNITKLVIEPLLSNEPFITEGYNIIRNLGEQLQSIRRPAPEVYVRINSATKYQKCSIIGVRPESDVAVLKVISTDTNNNNNDTSSSSTTFQPIRFGSSSSLLVGQKLIAIGNPFGLDNTVTTGVVSALNRELPIAGGGGGGRGRGGLPNPTSIQQVQTIRNCIQTDCAINPGNSGGPLLNRLGEVVGINTAILTSSGTNTGIGFAVPSDQVQPIVTDIIRADKLQQQQKQNYETAYLGVSIWKVPPKPTSEKVSESKQQQQQHQRRDPTLLWIQKIDPESPAAIAGLRPLVVDNNNDTLAVTEYGDAILAINGNTITTYEQFQNEILSIRKPNEQITLTILNGTTNEKRIVYITLSSRRI